MNASLSILIILNLPSYYKQINGYFKKTLICWAIGGNVSRSGLDYVSPRLRLNDFLKYGTVSCRNIKNDMDSVLILPYNPIYEY